MTEFFANNVAADYTLLVLIFTQIPIVFIYTTRMYCLVYSHHALSRNTEWVANHPEFTRHISYGNMMRLIGYMIAVLSLASIGYYIFQNPDPVNIVPMLFLPQIAWLVGILLYTVALNFKVTRTIPLADRRSTILEDQSLAAYVPHWVVALGYIGLLLMTGVYLWALTSGTLTSALATARLSGLGGIIIIVTGVLVYALRRKHSELDFVFSVSGRKIEVRATVAVLYLGVLAGLMRILGDFFDIHIFATGTFFIVISITVQGSFLAFYKYISNKLTLG